MRVRYVADVYSFGGPEQSLDRHYRELRDELLGQGRHYALPHHAVTWRPPADIHETTDAIVVKLELAGMHEEQLEITVYENGLVVSGRRDDDAKLDDCLCFHEAQVHYGPFRAEFRLPVPVEREDAAVSYERGFLRIRLRKAVAADQPEPREPSILARGTSGAFTSDAAPATVSGGVLLAAVPGKPNRTSTGRSEG
ncbi:MAG TPA: Hsp20/alpha crystallin family protein [Ktedonobacterales bacterium]